MLTIRTPEMPMPSSPEDVLHRLDLFAWRTRVGRRRMELFDALVMAAATAVGGETVRDLFLDRHPVFLAQALRYLGVIAGAGGGTFAYILVFRPPVQSLEVADALGLAVFTVGGASVALGVEAPPVVVVIMGGTTATVGGMVRDVLCDETPLILREEIYATAALAGGVLFLGLHALAVPEAVVVGVTIVGVFATRLAALRWQLHLPSFQVDDV